jgi:hypothetical protein
MIATISKQRVSGLRLFLGTFLLAASVSFSSSLADITWNGSVASVGPIQFGGSPYCNYQVTLQNLQMVLSQTGNAYSSTVQCLVVEESLNGCPFPPNAPSLHHYTASGAGIIKTGNDFLIVYSPDPGNNPQCSLVFDGTLSGNSVFGDLTFHRADQPSPLDWTATPFIQIFTPPPQITCPPDIEVCPSQGTDPNITGFPTITFSCSPPNQVQLVPNDGPSDFTGTFTRTWTAVDPICGTSQECFQRITELKQDNPTISISSANDGLLLILQAVGTRGTITEATWQLENDTLSEGNGVHFVNPATVEIDLNVYNLAPGSFSVFVNVKTSCTASGGAGQTGSTPPPYVLSRTLFTAPNASPGSGNRPLTVTCGTPTTTYGPSNRSFRFKADDNGAALIRASSPTARLAGLAPGSSLVQPTALDCGTQALHFLVNAGVTYSVVVEASENFTMSSQIFDPSKVLALSGNLDFGTVGVGTQTTRTLVVQNNGTLPLNVTSISYPSGYGGDWSGGVVQPGTPQNVTVALNPPTAGNYNGTITVNSEAGNKTIAVTASAIVIPIKTLTLSAGNLDFGSVTVGSSKGLTYNIKNTGNATVTVNSIQYPNGFGGNFSGALLPDASQTVTVTFTPGAAITYSGNVTINSDATSVTPLNLSGNGIQPIQTVLGGLTLPASLDFGSVTAGSSVTRSFTINNTNSFAVTVLTIKFPANSKGDWNGGTLASGASQIVNVQFTPTQPMIFVDSLVVTADAPQALSSITVLANVVEAVKAIIKLNGSLAFGNVPVGTSKSGMLNIENIGNSVLTVTGITYPEDVTGNFNTGELKISPQGSTTVNVTFSPRRAGSYAGNIEVKSNASEGGNTFSIQGTAFVVSFVATDLRRPANGLFELTVSVPAGKKLIVEASADFRFWRTVATRSTFGGELTLLDLIPTADRAQFYRFRLE